MLTEQGFFLSFYYLSAIINIDTDLSAIRLSYLLKLACQCINQWSNVFIFFCSFPLELKLHCEQAKLPQLKATFLHSLACESLPNTATLCSLSR